MKNIGTSPSCEGNDKGENAVLNTFDLYLDNIDESTVVPSETHREASPLDEELSQIRLPASFSMTLPISIHIENWLTQFF